MIVRARYRRAFDLTAVAFAAFAIYRVVDCPVGVSAALGGTAADRGTLRVSSYLDRLPKPRVRELLPTPQLAAAHARPARLTRVAPVRAARPPVKRLAVPIAVAAPVTSAEAPAPATAPASAPEKPRAAGTASPASAPTGEPTGPAVPPLAEPTIPSPDEVTATVEAVVSDVQSIAAAVPGVPSAPQLPPPPSVTLP